jgi:hypothetical protein
LTPVAGRTTFEVAGERAAFDSRFSLPSSSTWWNERPLRILRDPFVPEKQTQAPTSTIPSAAMPVVTAIVTGRAPHALVEDRGRIRVVAVGDSLGGSRVAAIDERGARLQNGLLLPLTEDRP